MSYPTQNLKKRFDVETLLHRDAFQCRHFVGLQPGQRGRSMTTRQMASNAHGGKRILAVDETNRQELFCCDCSCDMAQLCLATCALTNNFCNSAECQSTTQQLIHGADFRGNHVAMLLTEQVRRKHCVRGETSLYCSNFGRSIWR